MTIMPENQVFTIREAHIEDLDRIYFHWLGGVGHALAMELDPLLDAREERYKESFRNKFREVGCIFKIWVAVDEQGEVIGWEYLMPFENNPAVRHLTAEFSIYLSPAHRGQGIGTALLRMAIGHARHTPLQFIVGYVSAENSAMQAVCEKLGFVKAGEYPPPLKEPYYGRSYMYLYAVPGPGEFFGRADEQTASRAT